MSSYNLNEALKKKAAAKTGSGEREMHLDDVSRVKVLSPGRQVFLRFIRNRLAVFGLILLSTMFVFSFLGPVVYPYGQKQIFYKYNSQNVNYALAKENSAYTGYALEDGAPVGRSVANRMNTQIKAMEAGGRDRMLFAGDDGAFYQVDRLGENIYALGRREAEQVCRFGASTVHIGTFDAVGKKMQFSAEAPGDGFVSAASEACKGASGSFEYEGVTYSFQKAAGKKFDISAEREGFVYSGDQLGAEFEAAAEAAAASDPYFEWGGGEYAVIADAGNRAVFSLGGESVAMVYTRYVLDTFASGTRMSDSFRSRALLAAYGSGRFEADGAEYSVEDEGGALVIRDAAGSEYAEFSTFAIRRYNGEDTMEYALKNAVRAAIGEMTAAGQRSASLVFPLPRQNEVGEYAYGADGSLLYNDTELRIAQKDTGEYVLNCDQIIYMIDMYASPSLEHFLGTDGDGFDVLSRIMYGGRVSLMVGFVVVFLEILLGVILGGLAGYYGGWVDNVIMRMVDIFYCLPYLAIMIIIGSMMDAMRMDTYVRLIVMMAALGVMGWVAVARLVRGQILSLREQEYMIAAEATGIRVKDRIFRHLIPNVMPQLIVFATMGIGSVILTESTLSFLGLGVKHPLATWGTIINSVSSASAMAHYAFIWIPVGLLICLTVIAFNFVGDGLRDAYDPKSRR
ncbi:MAG: ABC transporter permease [Clostridiales bacterium]|nr:ABC transporter permease [Clostridiales bacterium]